MSLRIKFNLILGLAAILGILGTGYYIEQFLKQNAREEVLNSARIMLESARAVRGYTVSEIRPLLALQQKRKFLPQTVPAYSARKYLDKLQQHYPEYSYKEATLNPTNPVDRASVWEEDIIHWFQSHTDEKELVGERMTATGRSLYLSQPIKITNAACLVCHSTPANAPATMIDAYGPANGFGWKHNEIVGAQVVSVPMSLPLQRAEETFYRVMIALIIVFGIIAILLNVMLHYVIIRPVKVMAANADKVSLGKLDAEEMVVRGKDEISSLAQSFNRMHRSLTSAVKMLDDAD